MLSTKIHVFKGSIRSSDRSFSNVPFVTFKPDLHMVKVRSRYICHGNFNSLMNAHQQCLSNLIPLMNLKKFNFSTCEWKEFPDVYCGYATVIFTANINAVLFTFWG